MAENRLTFMRHEARAMMLYVSIVLLVEVAALPAGPEGNSVAGPTGVTLVGLIWGTTIGLALAHWFAFQVAEQGLSNTELRHDASTEIVAEVAGAAVVAVLATVPIVLLPDDAAQKALPFMLALIIGGVAYLVERGNGRARGVSLLWAVAAVALGFTVAGAKYWLSYH